MSQLTKPSRELAERIMTEVSFADRIKGTRMREHVGPLSLTMYSFEEVANFLDDEFPALDFSRLKKWFRETFQDLELADKLALAIQESENNHEIALKARDLMQERLEQTKEVLSETIA